MGLLKDLRKGWTNRRVNRYCAAITSDASSETDKITASIKLCALGRKAVAASPVLAQYLVQSSKHQSPGLLASLIHALAQTGPDEAALGVVVDGLRYRERHVGCRAYADNTLRLACAHFLLALGEKAQPAAQAIADGICEGMSWLPSVQIRLWPNLWQEHSTQAQMSRASEANMRLIVGLLLKAICKLNSNLNLEKAPTKTRLPNVGPSTFAPKEPELAYVLKCIAQYETSPMLGRYALLALVLHFPSVLSSLEITNELKASAADLLAGMTKAGAATEEEARACQAMLETASTIPVQWEPLVATLRKCVE